MTAFGSLHTVKISFSPTELMLLSLAIDRQIAMTKKDPSENFNPVLSQVKLGLTQDNPLLALTPQQITLCRQTLDVVITRYEKTHPVAIHNVYDLNQRLARPTNLRW